MGLKVYLKRAERRVLRPLGRLFRKRPLAPVIADPEILERLARLERRTEALEAMVREDLGLRYLQADESREPERHPTV